MFLIFVEVHIGVCSYLFEHQPYHFLLLRWKKNIATPTLEILVASEVEDKGSHELVILLRVHPLLEVGETASEDHRLFIAIVCARFVLAASGGVDKMQILFILLHHHGVSHLVQTSSCHRATAMLTYWIALGEGCIIFLWHNHLCFGQRHLNRFRGCFSILLVTFSICKYKVFYGLIWRFEIILLFLPQNMRRWRDA